MLTSLRYLDTFAKIDGWIPNYRACLTSHGSMFSSDQHSARFLVANRSLGHDHSR
jgi:hypothetical protein